MSDLAPILLVLYSIEDTANIIGAVLRPVLIGEAGRFHSANNNIFVDSPRFIY